MLKDKCKEYVASALVVLGLLVVGSLYQKDSEALSTFAQIPVGFLSYSTWGFDVYVLEELNFGDIDIDEAALNAHFATHSTHNTIRIILEKDSNLNPIAGVRTFVAGTPDAYEDAAAFITLDSGSLTFPAWRIRTQHAIAHTLLNQRTGRARSGSDTWELHDRGLDFDVVDLAALNVSFASSSMIPGKGTLNTTDWLGGTRQFDESISSPKGASLRTGESTSHIIALDPDYIHPPTADNPKAQDQHSINALELTVPVPPADDASPRRPLTKTGLTGGRLDPGKTKADLVPGTMYRAPAGGGVNTKGFTRNRPNPGLGPGGPGPVTASTMMVKVKGNALVSIEVIGPIFWDLNKEELLSLKSGEQVGFLTLTATFLE